MKIRSNIRTNLLLAFIVLILLKYLGVLYVDYLSGLNTGVLNKSDNIVLYTVLLIGSMIISIIMLTKIQEADSK